MQEVRILPTNTPDDALVCYSVKGLAEDVGISLGSVYKEIREGRLKAKKIGGRTLITKKDAVRWLNYMPTAAPFRAHWPRDESHGKRSRKNREKRKQ